jgi:NitT/TauT family transport system permease protein
MFKRTVKQVIFYSLILFLWETLCLLRIWPEYLFPAPFNVLQTLLTGFIDEAFLFAIAVSFKRILIGYFISLLIGGTLGILISRYRLIDETLGGLVLGLQTLPSVCWLPLALLWFGLNEKAIIFVVVMGALFSITIAVDSGIKNVPPIFIRAGRNMGARRIRMFVDVIIPAALPSIVSGLKQAWSFAWRSLMAAELLFVTLGLGYLLMMGRELNDMSQVIAVMLVIAFVSVVIDRLFFGALESSLRKRWGVSGSISEL